MFSHTHTTKNDLYNKSLAAARCFSSCFRALLCGQVTRVVIVFFPSKWPDALSKKCRRRGRVTQRHGAVTEATCRGRKKEKKSVVMRFACLGTGLARGCEGFVDASCHCRLIAQTLELSV